MKKHCEGKRENGPPPCGDSDCHYAEVQVTLKLFYLGCSDSHIFENWHGLTSLTKECHASFLLCFPSLNNY